MTRPNPSEPTHLPGLMTDYESLESSSRLFRLLFFGDHTSNQRFLGIQYMNYSSDVTNYGDRMTVWVANRNNPLNDSSGVLSITQDGNYLVITTHNGKSIILNSGHPAMSANTSLTLLDSGNLVLRAEGERIAWQSFDYPTDKWLPGMKLGLFDLNDTTAGKPPRQQFLTSWIDSSGNINIFTSSQAGWILQPGLPCDADGVEERREGCVKGESSKCKGGDVFNFTRAIMSTWDLSESGNRSLGLGDCMQLCTRYCSCNAYASALSDMSGCKFSYGKVEYLGGENYLYIRKNALVEKGSNDTPPGHPNTAPPDHPKKRKLWLIIGGPFASLLVLAALSLFCYLRCSNWLFGGATNELTDAQQLVVIGKNDDELPLFSFPSIQFATNHFSDANKIGQGGFGPVYKGKLDGGLEIAVKRLSRSSGQGFEEFKNEVLLISKLQHRNLVRLLGCCTHGDERILVYEYLQNKSLDSFLFDATKRALLDWELRISIIDGIAQGLLYLHKYSRLKIIHRDLKTSNILLDDNMNPKISDFGTARIFGENESRASTSRIVGTYGYMSPEYAMDGLFSEKSDVFSFGVMTLEIISGKRNTGFYQSDRCFTLLGYAWDLWKEGRGIDIMDQELAETCPSEVLIRYIQVGLLCVQESAADRPTMSNVVSMIGNETMALPPPKKPAFSAVVCTVNYSDLSQTPEPCSNNEVTMSEVQPR